MEFNLNEEDIEELQIKLALLQAIFSFFGSNNTSIKELDDMNESDKQIIQRKQEIFNKIFSSNSLKTAQEASKKERMIKPLNSISLTYGEIDFQSFAEIFYMINLKHPGLLKKGGIFYDLGSGIGKGVIAATLLHDFDKCIGIELLDCLHNMANDVKMHYEQFAKDFHMEDQDIRIRFDNVEDEESRKEKEKEEMSEKEKEKNGKEKEKEEMSEKEKERSGKEKEEVSEKENEKEKKESDKEERERTNGKEEKENDTIDKEEKEKANEKGKKEKIKKNELKITMMLSEKHKDTDDDDDDDDDNDNDSKHERGNEKYQWMMSLSHENTNINQEIFIQNPNSYGNYRPSMFSSSKSMNSNIKDKDKVIKDNDNNNNNKETILSHKIKLAAVEFIKGDILKLDWTSGNFIFANSTCFDNDLLYGIAKIATKLPKDTIFVTFTKKLPDEVNWTVLETFVRNMSWGKATVYIQIKKTDSCTDEELIKSNAMKKRKNKDIYDDDDDEEEEEEEEEEKKEEDKEEDIFKEDWRC